MKHLIKETTAVSYSIQQLRDSFLKEIMSDCLGRPVQPIDYKSFSWEEPDNPEKSTFLHNNQPIGTVKMYPVKDGMLWNLRCEFTPF